MFRPILLVSLACVLVCGSLAKAQLTSDGSTTAARSLEIPETDAGLPGVGPIRRYDWFRKLWSQRRGQWAMEKEQAQNALVFLGDSITQGWGPTIGNAFDAKVANRGISGDTTRGVLIRLKADVLDLNPSGVVMLIGTNDLEEGASPEEIATNLRLILDELTKHKANMPIVLCRVFPSSTAKKRPAEDIQQVNQRYAELVKDYDQVSMLDTYSLFANEQGDAKLAEFPDLLHPNELGYDKWARALRPVLEVKGICAPKEYSLLFNDRDLTGWMFRPSTEQDKREAENWRKNDPHAPPWPIVETAHPFDGKTQSPDGRYVAVHGRLVVTIPKEGRRIQQLWTQAEFPEDFELKLEFRASPNADSGIFIRGKQLQCRDYLLAGPYKQLQKYRPLDWNEITIIVRGDTAYCTCNGEVLEAEFKVPATGPIGLEGDRGQMEYRRIRWRSLP